MLKDLTDAELHDLALKTVRLERLTLNRIVDILEETDRRESYQPLYPTLVRYCIEGLGYCQKSAYARIAVMKLAREVPGLKDSLVAGRLQLTNLNLAVQVFNEEAKQNSKFYSPTEKADVLRQLEGKTTWEAKKILAEESSVILSPDSLKAGAGDKVQLNALVDDSLIQKLDRIKSFASHKMVNPTYNELLHYMADIVLAEIDPSLEPRSRRRKAEAQGESGAERSTRPPASKLARPKPNRPTNPDPRAISAVNQRRVWQRADCRCEFQDPQTGRRCNSTFQLQIDHIVMVAFGGTNEFENLRLACSSHNQYLARTIFGRYRRKSRSHGESRQP